MFSINESEFLKLTSFLKSNYGINLTQKRNLIEGRLSNLITDKGFSNFHDYLSMVFSDNTGNEVTQLINKLTTNHTFFMREFKSLEFYRNNILPEVTARSRDNDLRVWSAGCSSGEEPYTIAMINKDFFSELKVFWDTKVLATDISAQVLDKAQTGIYDAEAVDVLPSLWKLKYLNSQGNGKFQFKDEIKREVIFRIFNLMENEFPFRKRFHTIFCRNVMIYFDTETKQRLVSKFFEHTEPGGYLIIGQSESINREMTDYKYIMPSIYRKI